MPPEPASRSAGPDRASEIANAGEAARALLEARHRARELTLPVCRRATRECALAIRAAHRHDLALAREHLGHAAGLLAEADAACAEHSAVREAGFVHDAQKEYAEANLTLAYVTHQPAPGPGDLGVEIPAYLNGMAEAASELRRYILDLLRRGRPERGEELLGYMDEVYSLLITIDFPDAMTGGLRRTTDALRGVLERTRGDLTMTLLQSRLLEGIESRVKDS
jgi:translin